MMSTHVTMAGVSLQTLPVILLMTVEITAMKNYHLLSVMAVSILVLLHTVGETSHTHCHQLSLVHEWLQVCNIRSTTTQVTEKLEV